MDVFNILNTNAFVGFATILTGLAALWVYFSQKNNSKIQAARVLLTEIRIAEERVNQIREKMDTPGIPQDLPPVFTTRNWSKYSALFISDFDEDELKLLNAFYDCGGLIEEFANRNNNYIWITTEERAKIEVQKVAEFASASMSATLAPNETRDTYVTTRRDELSRLLDAYNSGYVPKKTIDSIKVLIAKMPAITTSSCGSKLKRLARLR